MIPVTPEIRQRLKSIKEKHPQYYESYDKTLRVACILLEKYLPQTIFTCLAQTYAVVKIPPNTPEKEVKKRLNKALDIEQSLLEEDLKG